VLSRLPHSASAALLGRGYFPHLIAAPFGNGLHEAFDFAAAACLVAALASWSRGSRYVYGTDEPAGYPPHAGQRVAGQQAGSSGRRPG
jgi:hypothetical protein